MFPTPDQILTSHRPGSIMSGADRLGRLLSEIDGTGYGAYRRIVGSWSLSDLTLMIDRVQADPFASPSRLRIRIAPELSNLPRDAIVPGPRAVGTSCFLARSFSEAAGTVSGRRGSGHSGVVRIAAPGQEVVPNTAVILSEAGGVEVRFTVGLPARGRRVLGREAARLLLEDVPRIARESLLARSHERRRILLHAETNETADLLRQTLRSHGLVAFVAEGAVLPRRSGVDDRPMTGDSVVAFRSPESLRRTVTLPAGQTLTGMGIPEGITLVAGGGYHGKSTLLEALAAGVYNHRPGDGRERVVTDPDAVEVRSEPGRSVSSVDVSAFIGNLPGGEVNHTFSTDNASGSTSQAAAVSEAREGGASVLLLDEDRAATNFMIRDRRMQELVPKELEPITPFIERVRELHRRHGVSAILVIGGSGDYLEVADTVVRMTGFLPEEVTEQARSIVRNHPSGRLTEARGSIDSSPHRRPAKESVDPSRGRRKVSVRARGTGTLQFGTGEIDLAAVAQIRSESQLRAIGEALVLARDRFMDDRTTVAEITDRVCAVLAREGLDALGPDPMGNLAHFRRHEFIAALNRLRGLRMVQD